KEEIFLKDELGSQNKKQLLSQAQMQLYAKKLDDLMISQKLYLDPNLNLYQLSSFVGLRTQELSFLLNNHFQINFYTYINNYRIEESKTNLSDPEKKNLSMVGIALESGFKSKSTFYSRFKEATGLSPTEYLKKGKE
ncbi:MAG: helix-turn-helix domain-containing protein, partial [Bacteroidota bacterium]